MAMIAMMIFIHLIILLTIGFGVGYWLLITASKYEGRLKTIGESLGFTLIILVILSAVFGFFSSMKIDDSDYMPSMKQENMQKLYREQNDNIQNPEQRPMMNNEKSEENGETRGESQENENGPVKNNIKDHE